MKFRFCGDLDCPDWVLAEITILARMSSVKMKLLSGQILMTLLGNAMDFDKVAKYTSDAKYDSGEVKAAIAALTFIISNAAKYNVESSALSDELQQLGLPKEHATALCKLYADNAQELQSHLKQRSLRLPRIEDVKWTVAHILDSLAEEVIEEPIATITIMLKDQTTEHFETRSIVMTSRKLHLLIYEMRQAREVLQSVKKTV